MYSNISISKVKEAARWRTIGTKIAQWLTKRTLETKCIPGCKVCTNSATWLETSTGLDCCQAKSSGGDDDDVKASICLIIISKSICFENEGKKNY